MRRLTGLLSSLLLLHLTLVGADLTCAKHGLADAQPVSQSETSSHQGHHAPAGPQGAGQGDTSCEVPTVPACCEALASCGVSIAGNPSADAGDLSHVTAGVRAGAADAPTSWSLEPDPPPPKA